MAIARFEISEEIIRHIFRALPGDLKLIKAEVDLESGKLVVLVDSAAIPRQINYGLPQIYLTLVEKVVYPGEVPADKPISWVEIGGIEVQGHFTRDGFSKIIDLLHPDPEVLAQIERDQKGHD